MTIPAYCTIGDVEAHTGKGYTGKTNPSRTRVQLIIQTVSQELNGALQAAGYTLPVSSAATDALEMLRGYAALGGAYRAWYAATRGSTVFPAAASWREDYLMALKGLREDLIALPGIDPEDGGTEQFTGLIRSVKLTG